MIEELEERHDESCEGDGGGRLSCGCAPRQEQASVAELERLRAIEAAAVALVEHWDSGAFGAGYNDTRERLEDALSATVRGASR